MSDELIRPRIEREPIIQPQPEANLLATLQAELELTQNELDHWRRRAVEAEQKLAVIKAAIA